MKFKDVDKIKNYIDLDAVKLIGTIPIPIAYSWPRFALAHISRLALVITNSFI